MNVIITEDSAIVRSGLEKMLKTEEDINIIGVASNGLEALQILKHITADVSITDLNMPEMDGFELVKKVNQMIFS